MGRGSFSSLLAEGKEDPVTETEAGLGLFQEQHKGGRWGRGGTLPPEGEKCKQEFWAQELGFCRL